MRAHRCVDGGQCDCPLAAGHGCPVHLDGQLVHHCGVTIHPAYLAQPLRDARRGELKLSILTATYRRPAQLAQLIDMVDRQTYRPLEHVIVADGPDGLQGEIHTDSGVERSYHRLGRCWTPHDLDKGATAFWVALALASGEAVVYVPDDDELLPDFASDVIAAFEAGADVYEPLCQLIDDNGRQQPTHDVLAHRAELAYWQPTEIGLHVSTIKRWWLDHQVPIRWAQGEHLTYVRRVGA